MPDNFILTSNLNELDAIDLETEGYDVFEKSGEGDSSGNEHFKFFNSEEETEEEGLTKTGKQMSSHLATIVEAKDFKDNIFFGKDNRVFGLPFKYTQLADPMSRVFQSTFETDASCIAFIKFGIPLYNKLLYQKMAVNANGDAASLGLGLMLGLRSAVRNDGVDARDQRIVSFKPNTKEFMKYALASINELYMLMDLPGKFDVTGFDDFDNHGFAFYCVRTGSVSETLSNNYSTPDAIDKMNSDALIRRQNYQMFGTYGNVNTDGTATAFLENIANGYLEKITENIANSPIIGSIASVFMKCNKGSMSFYGQVWGDSNKSTAYNMQFKFRSPYGNRYDIFRNVFFPFLLLHTAAMPKQDGRFSYQEPFLVMIDFPGWFRVNCGVIKELTWTKGGDASLYNIDGLPMEINVTMNVEDLYPIELASKDITVMEYNWGLLSFLENLAGLSVSQVATVSPYITRANKLRIEMAKSDGSIMGNAIANLKATFNTNFWVNKTSRQNQLKRTGSAIVNNIKADYLIER